MSGRKRIEMDEALKRIVVPHLRALDFKGSMPAFRRERADRIDLLSVQHSQWGGAFCIEMARVGVDGVSLPDRHIPADKARTFHSRNRRRLGSTPGVADHWFRYEERDADAVAEEVIALLDDPRQWESLDSMDGA